MVCLGNELRSFCHFEIAPKYWVLETNPGSHWKDWCWSSNTLVTWCKGLTHWKRPWCWEELRARGEGTTEDEMVGWHHRLNGHEFEQTPGDSGGQGSLACKKKKKKPTKNMDVVKSMLRSWTWLSNWIIQLCFGFFFWLWCLLYFF